MAGCRMAPSPRCAPIWTKDWDSNPERFKRQPFPAWSFETIKYLYEQRGVTATGHESMDTDTTDKMDSETWILQHRHYQIEVMANLDKVPPHRRTYRGDLAESGKRPWLSRARFRDFAVNGVSRTRLECCAAPGKRICPHATLRCDRSQASISRSASTLAKP